MVEVTVFVEGGVLPNDNIAVQTLDNSQKLRESFYNIIYKLVDNTDFSINIQPSSGYKQAVKFFKNRLTGNTILIIDLENPKEYRDGKLIELELQDYGDKVFFMIQEMEAWILSQPEQIEECYKNRYKREKSDIEISEDNLIKGKHPEDIVKPSWVLKVLLKRYFSYEKRNKKKKKEYGKLKDAPELLNSLNVNKLHDVFSDVKSLTETVKNMK